MTKYTFITLKRYAEQVIMYPFILAGKIIARTNPLAAEYDFFVFFPIFGMGGAEKINGDIIAALPDKQIIIFFTRKSKDDALLHLFQKPNVTIKDISRWTDNKFIYWANLIWRGICAGYINKQRKKPVVFNGQCNFAYKLFPHIDRNILKVELIHNSYKQFAWVTFPYIPFIDKRVMITESIIRQHKDYYRTLGIPRQYEERIVKIINSAFVPADYPVRVRGEKLKVYYAGRGGYQKHLELLFEIIQTCIQRNYPMEFHLAGTFEDEIPTDLKGKINWHGNISRQEDMYTLHKSMDVLVMTSRFEGFPLAIMEGMSCGVAIISTGVDGIPEHVKHGENGFLLTGSDEEIVADGIKYLELLASDRPLLTKISHANYEYAKGHFSKEVFVKAYRHVFELDK